MKNQLKKVTDVLEGETSQKNKQGIYVLIMILVAIAIFAIGIQFGKAIGGFVTAN